MSSDSYPIVYTAMPIKLKLKTDKNNSQIETICCVPVKSYLVTETKHYLPNHKPENTYGVVFSWKQKTFDDVNYLDKGQTPLEDESNLTHVRAIFSSKEQCIENIKIRNSNLTKYLTYKFENNPDQLQDIINKQTQIMTYALKTLYPNKSNERDR